MTHPSIWLRKVAKQSPEVQNAFNAIVLPKCKQWWDSGCTDKFTMADFKQINPYMSNLQPKHMRSLGILFSDLANMYPYIFICHGKNSRNHKVYSIIPCDRLAP
ncbi:hypothetical protein NGH30_07225 [Macrococcus caseolyticus]|uniref:hypothetical protein n=1 Tax=Macrococcoides caseolyticum TaxID=69966 RepID=UPI002DB660AF|nr:hypothetical protein [Macrococcus caseolyticus]MEB8171626.1 hypothetical protein [Macrococcus caseolyticus]